MKLLSLVLIVIGLHTKASAENCFHNISGGRIESECFNDNGSKTVWLKNGGGYSTLPIRKTSADDETPLQDDATYQDDGSGPTFQKATIERDEDDSDDTHGA